MQIFLCLLTVKATISKEMDIYRDLIAGLNYRAGFATANLPISVIPSIVF